MPSNLSNPNLTRVILQINQAAKLLNVSKDTLRRWEKTGKISSTRTSSGYRTYDLTDLLTQVKDKKLRNLITSKYPELKTLAEENPEVTNKRLLKISQAAQALGVSKDTLRRWEKSGKVESQRTDSGYRVYDLSKLLNNTQPKIKKPSQNTSKDYKTTPIFTETPKIILSSEQSILKSLDEIETPVFTQPVEENSNSPIQQLNLTGWLKKQILTISLTLTALLLLTIPGVFLTNYVNNYQNQSNLSKASENNPFNYLLAFFGKHPPGNMNGQKLSQDTNPSTRRDLGNLNGGSVLGTTGQVLQAASPSGSFLEINLDTQINGSLDTTALHVGTNAAIDGPLTLNTVEYTFPDTQGVQNTFLQNNGQGTLTWTAVPLPPAATNTTLGIASFSSTNFTVTAGAVSITNASITGSQIASGTVANSNLANSSITVSAGTGMSGGGSVSLGGSVTLTNAGVTSITGTSNQVIASGSTGSVTLTLPQDIATSSDVEFDSLELTTGLLLNGSTSGTITVAAPATVTSYTLTLPTDDGTASYVLSTDGNGATSWVAVGGSSCPTCVITNPSSTQTITPTSSTAVGLSVAQASGGSVDIFNVTNNGGGTEYLTVDSSGNTTITGSTTNTGTLNVTGAITAPTSTNTINNLIINSGALSGVTGFTQASGGFSATGLSSGSISVTSANLALATATSGNITLTTGAATGLVNILTGNLNVGNGTPTLTQDGEDAYVEGTFEVDGVATFGSNVGIGTTAPQTALSLPSGSTGISLYNTADMTTNYERGLISWSSNIFKIATEEGGTGSGRQLQLSATGSNAAVTTLTLDRDNAPFMTLTPNTSSVTGTWFSFTGTSSASSSSANILTISPTITQSGTAGYTALLINPTESSTGSGARILADFQVGSTSRMLITSAGNVGIGTTAPSGLLHLASTGDVSLYLDADTDNTDENDNPALRLRQDGGTEFGTFGLVGDAGQIYTGSISNAVYIGSFVTDIPVQFVQESLTRMTIDASGNLGIGDTSPSARLEVGDATDSLQVSSVGDITFVDANDGASITGPAGGALAINASATGLNLQADGSIDVNIAGGSSATGCTVANSTGNLTCTGDITGSGTIGAWTRNSGSGYTYLANSSDNVGLGTSTPTSKLYINATQTSGNIFKLAYDASVTIAGDTTGLLVDLNSGNVTATNQNLYGVNFKIPTVTNTHTSGTKTLTGALVNFGSGAGISQTGAGGTTEFIAGDFQLPALTQSAGTLNAYGLKVTTPATITTGGTAYGAKFVTTGVGAGTLYGVSIDNITGGAGTEYALNVAGTGWDAVLRVGSTTVINGSGVTQEAGGGTGESTYTTGDILYASAANTLDKLAIGGSDGYVLKVQSGVPVWGTVTGSSCTNCLISDPSSTQTIAPTGASTQGLSVRQTSTALGGNTQDIFNVTSSDGNTKYFYVDYQGNVSSGSISNTNLTITPTTDSTALTLVGTNVTSAKNQYVNTKNSSGTIFDISYGAAQTLAGTIIGHNVDLSTNVTATNQSVSGYVMTLPASTSTSGTQNYKGLVLTSGAMHSNTGNTALNWYGADITIPALTQTAGTLTAYGIQIDTPSSITTGGTAYGLQVNASGVGAGTLNGINITGITAGAGAETGLVVGSGWDYSATFANNVGIGTTAPGALLVVNGGGAATEAHFLSGGASNNLSLRIGRASEDGALGVAGGTGQFSDIATQGDVILRASTTDLILSARDASGNIYLSTGSTDTAKLTVLNGGNVGIGTTAPASPLDVRSTTNGATALTVALSSQTSGTPYGADISATVASATSGTFKGVRGSTVVTGTNSGINIVGIEGYVASNNGSTTITSAKAVLATPTSGAHNEQATTFTDLYAFYASGPLLDTTGVATRAYGLYLEAVETTGVTTGYGIYQAGASDTNYFAGNVGIGDDTSPDALLELSSSDTDGGDFLITNTGAGTSGTVASIVSNSTTTGDLLTISGTSLTSGTALTLTGPTGGSTGVTDHFAKITADVSGNGIGLLNLNPVFDGGASAAQSYGLYISSSTTGTLGTDVTKVSYNINTTMSSASTGADTADIEQFEGIRNHLAISGDLANASTRRVYTAVGTINDTATANHASSTTELTGALYSVTSTSHTEGTTNMFGVDIVTSLTQTAGTVTNYGIRIQNGTSSTGGTSTKYGLYIADQTGADTGNNYNIFSAGSTGVNYFGGNVGIGTSAPTSPLYVSNGTTGVNVARILASGNASNPGQPLTISNGYATSSGSGAYEVFGVWANNFGTQLFTVRDNGYVGIGTTAPASKLEIVGANATTATPPPVTLALRASYVDGNSRHGLAFYVNSETEISAGIFNTIQNGGELAFFTSSNVFTTDATEKVRITGTGNVGIGTTAPSSLLHLSSSATTTDVQTITATSLTTGSALVLTGSTAAPGQTDALAKLTASVGNIGRATGVLDINTTMNPTGGGEAVSISNHITASPTNTAINVFGQNNDISDSTALANTLIGSYFNVANSNTGTTAKGTYGIWTNVTSTGTGGEVLRGAYLTATKTGASSTGTPIIRGVEGIGTSSGITDTTASFTYGGHFTATGNTGGTNSVAIGVVGFASGADLNYPLYMGTAPVSSGTAALCWVPSTESPVNDCSGSPVVDYAEIYPTENGMTFGEIAVVGSELVPTSIYTMNKDSSADFQETKLVAKLIKSSNQYQKGIIGITSNNYGDFTSTGHGSVGDEHHPLPVALSGRVPLKVSTENGPIQPGDYITTSSIPGVGMKATKPGQMVGKALEGFNGGGVGKIMVFVNIVYADPTDALANLLIGDQGQLLTSSPTFQKIIVSTDIKVGGLVKASGFTLDASAINRVGALASVPVSSEGKVSLADAVNSLNNQIAINDERITNNEQQVSEAKVLGEQAVEHAQTLDEKVASTSGKLAALSAQIEELLNGSSSSSSETINDEPITINDLTPPSILESTGSASLANINITEKASIINLEALDATVSATFKSLGETFLGRTTIAGDLSVDGTFSITEGNSLNSLPTLYFQNNPLAQLVDLFNGKVTIDKDGLVTLKKLAISGETLGSVVIPAGETKVTVNSSLITHNSKVFISTEKPISVGVNNKDTLNHEFDIEIAQALNEDLKVDWWLVDRMN